MKQSLSLKRTGWGRMGENRTRVVVRVWSDFYMIDSVPDDVMSRDKKTTGTSKLTLLDSKRTLKGCPQIL